MPSLDKITIDGVDYDLVDSGRPTSLKNPNALTFTGGISGSYDGSEAVSIDMSNFYTKGEVDAGLMGLLDELSDPANGTLVNKSGERGRLAGFERTVIGQAVSAESPDVMVTATNAVTVADGDAFTAWTKVVLLDSMAPTVTFKSNAWVWRDGEAPTLKQRDILVCTWIYSWGIASIISRSAS